MTEGTINIFDISGAIVLITFIIIIANFYKNAKTQNNPEYKYFTYGLITKLVGAIALAFVYVFYYGGGDTQMYFNGGKIMGETIFSDSNSFIKLFFSNRENLPIAINSIANEITYSKSNEEWFMIKITTILNLFSFGRYLISNIIISLIAFYGSWKMFKTFIYFFPKYQKGAFISIYLLPTVIFWSSGILKDTISFAALGIFFFHFVNIFYKNRFNVFSIIILVISAIIIFKLKAYIILGFMPGIFVALYISYKNKIQNKLIRQIFAPFIFIFVAISGYFLILNTINQSNKYKVETLESRVQGFHSWHTTTGGSSYNLGEVEYTTLGIISKVPASLNVTFFRPYLWETRNITSLMGAIESFAILILFILILWRYKLKWINLSLKNSFLSMAIIYSIVFGFAVGFTSYNFGALARYKVPVMPFFVFLLLYFYYKPKIEEQN